MKEELQDKELKFQKAQYIYHNSNNIEDREKAWNEMWFLVQECCKAIGKKLAYKTGVIVPDLEEKIVDGTIYVMEQISKKNVKIDKLSSYCYLRVYCKMYDKKTQNWEKLQSFDFLKEENSGNDRFFESITIL